MLVQILVVRRSGPQLIYLPRGYSIQELMTELMEN
jgi:hypothetical protein